jgi:Family of unknown function (DUF5996)
MNEPWPELRYEEWASTAQTLHMWMQIVGKIRMAKAPAVNHWWHVPLYVTSRGIGTSPIPHGGGTFEIDFDFVDHRLRITTTTGDHRELKLQPMTVADLYARLMSALSELGIDVEINTMPQEVADAIAFDKDTTHRSYDAAAAHRFWVALVHGCRVMTAFRSRFLGKVSPVHFFWGGDRSGGDPLLRPRGPAASRRAGTAAGGGTRGVLARSQQRGLLAGRQWIRGGVLLVRLSGAGGLFEREDQTGGGVLQQRPPRVPAAVRGRAHERVAG